MYSGVSGKRVDCVINKHCRTRVFEFPGMRLRSDEDEPYHTLFDLLPVRACAVSDLTSYFLEGTNSPHYSISPPLREAVAGASEKENSEDRDSIPLFLVIEEVNELSPVEMIKGECAVIPEVLDYGDKKEQKLIGGREGDYFIMAYLTIGGAWPEVPNNERWINLVLAGVRAGQRVSGAVLKHVDSACFVTDDDQFVATSQIRGTLRATRTTTLTPRDYRARVEEIAAAIASMEQDIDVPHIALLFNAMYMDSYPEDPYLRFQFLQLWQSMSEAGPRQLGHSGDIRKDPVIVAGNSTLLELNDYRDDIAHYWTESIDEGLLQDLQSTVNELVQHKYF